MSKPILIVFLSILILSTSCQVQQEAIDVNKSIELNNEISYGVSYLSLIQLHGEPSHRSEIVSQVLFGEFFKILKNESGWSLIELEQDQYQGWIQTVQITKTDKKTYDLIRIQPKTKVLSNCSVIDQNEKEIQLIKGSNLPFYKNEQFIMNEKKVSYTDSVCTKKQNREAIIKTALSFLNTPYLWGGKSQMGMDCSGFSQIVYHINGYKLPRDSYLQAKKGRKININDAQQGDLAFFANKDGRIVHVGIVLDENRIIHASQGVVHIDSLDVKGVFNIKRNEYTHNLDMIREYDIVL